MKNQKKSRPDSDQARKKSPPRSSSAKRPAETNRIEDIANPRQADKALRESEERFRQLAEATFEGITIHDKGLILDVNSSFCRMFGYDRADVIGKSVLELAAPKSRDLVIQNVRSGYEKPYEAVGLRRDGTTFAGELQGRSIQYQGRTVRVTAVRDITERKRAEAWQEAIFEGSRDAIFITAVDSRIAAVNEAACVLTGYSKEELLSMRIPDLHEEADLHAYQMYHDRIMAGEETFSEAKIFGKDGSKVDTEFNNRRIVIDGLPYMHTTARDITERKRTEARLRESEERYRDLVENSHELIYTHDLYGQILSVNHTAALRLGHNPSALVGRNLGELLAADEKALFEDYLGRIRRKGSATGVWMLQSATGERRIWEYTSSLRSDAKQGPYVRGMAHDTTERIRIEKELRESEERFHKIFDEGPIGMVLTSRDLKFFSANPAFCRMLGYTTEEMNTRTFLDVTHPEHRETDRQNVEKMWRGEISTYRTEKRYIAKNGDIRWGSLSTSLIRGQAGEPLYALAMVEDITERKQAEEALRESHQLLTKSFASLHDAIFILDKDTTEVKDCNPAASQLFGYDREEMLGRTTAFLHVDDQALAEFRKVLFKAVEEQGFLNQFEFRMKRRDGTIFPTEHSVMPIEDAHGKQSGWVSLVRDITERKQAEEALRESEYRYRTVFEGVEDAIFVQSTDGRILDANRGACEMFGYSHAEFLTKTVLDLVPSKDYVLTSNPNELLALPIHSIETVELRANGERFPIEISLSLQTLHGEDVFFVVGRDISERKRTETLLQQAKAFAENLIHTANVIIISMDMTGKIQIFNETAEKIAGYSRAELEGKNWFEVLVPKDRYPQVWQEFQLGGGGWPRVYENSILTKAGQERLISWQNNEVQEAGKIVGSISFGIDITERKRVEEALQESEQRYRLLYENSLDSVLLTAPDGSILSANPAACRMFGRTEAEICQLGRNGLIDTSDPRLPAALEERARTGSFEGELTGLRNDGTKFPFELTSSIFTNHAGQPRSSMIIRDITERKRAEELLRQSEERYKLMFEQAPIAINITRGTEIIYCNPTYLSVFGFASLKEIQSIPPLELFTPEWRPIFQENIRRRSQGLTSPNGYEAECFRKDGTRFSVQMNFVRTMFSDGLATVGFILDITESKRAEAALAASRTQLRALSQYLQAAREEERAYIAREIHDELGQALTAMKMDLAWLSRQLPPEQSELVEKTSAISDMVDSTIQMVRRVASQLRPGMLDDLGLVAALEWQAGEFQSRTGIACKLDLPENVTVLSQDQATTMFRIFQETLTNISRHARATRVNIAMRELPEYIDLVVRDNGIGITQGQLNDPRSLGLTGMRERVQTFGGTLQFKSSPGKGTSVHVRMPRVNMPQKKES